MKSITRKTRNRLRVIRGGDRWEPKDPDGGGSAILKFRSKRTLEAFAVHSASGKLIGRFIVRRDAIAALYFWPQASYIISGGQVIAKKADDTDESAAIVRKVVAA